MKRILSAIFAIALLVSSLILYSCSDTGRSNGSGSFFTFKITQDYVIVHPQDASFAEINTAKSICEAIKYSTGLSLEIIDDSNNTHEHEIVIGNAKRSGVSSAKIKTGDSGYTIFSLDNNVYIYGTSDNFLNIAVSTFISEYILNSITVTLSRTLNIVYNHEFKKPDLKINGIDISQYKIVYDPKAATTHYRTQGAGWVESSRFKDTAYAVADEIYLLAGKRLEVVMANDENETEHEILVGKIPSRDETSEFYITYGVGYSDDRYGFGVVGNKLLISGGSPNSAYFAAHAFYEFCEEMDGSDFNSPLKNDRTTLIKVACIGDGITHGTSSVSVNTHAYPIYLQQLLGFKYYVANYGTPNKKMTDFDVKTDDETNDGTTTEYERSISFVPDVIILMLGTNDADPKNSSWSAGGYAKLYSESAARMVTSYRKLNPNVQVYIVSPPAEAKSTLWRENLVTISQWNRTISEDLDCNFIDIFSASTALGWDFPDNLHPKNEQYADLAKAIYDGLKHTIRIK